MLFESLQGFEDKYEWNLVGHSGDGADIVFVDFGRAPRTKEGPTEHTLGCSSRGPPWPRRSWS